jgi:predicted enzyme related to lactoylglutathione lyase
VAKNRVHVDLVADDRDKEIARLLELGAERLDDKDEYGVRWTILADPEGNEFCLHRGVMRRAAPAGGRRR